MDEPGRKPEQVDERVRLLEDVQRAKQLRMNVQHLRDLQTQTSEAVERARALCAEADAKLREACETLDRLAGELGSGDPPPGC